MRGARAELVCVYQRTALLRDWTMHTLPNSDRVQLTATIESADGHRLSQRPLTVIVQRPPGRKPWRWPVLELQIAASGQSLTATLGPQE